jgi:hypothetical protein
LEQCLEVLPRRGLGLAETIVCPLKKTLLRLAQRLGREFRKPRLQPGRLGLERRLLDILTAQIGSGGSEITVARIALGPHLRSPTPAEEPAQPKPAEQGGDDQNECERVQPNLPEQKANSSC